MKNDLDEWLFIDAPADSAGWWSRHWRKTAWSVAIALSLIYLVMPRTSSCGEPMRQAACYSNLRQLGFGILDFEEAEGYFPPGAVANPSLTIDLRLSWNYAIMPHIDLYEPMLGVDLTKSSDDPALLALRTKPPNVDQCPSNTRRLGATYIGIGGLGIDSPGLPTKHPRAGFFGDDRVVTPADVRDGLANTMAVAETLQPGGSWIAGGRASVRGLDPSRRPYLGPDRQFGSNHGGTTDVLMADGSVRKIRDSVDPKVFEALSTIAGGEAVVDHDD